ncbi:hypothetical protein SELMODRAFT_410074 [Selaginella moellendorffii]|uniref:Uncharacterized protein n=1 Tax=Selaginella moellendorffii TaxID=88036 RepID=D8RDE0_SELML|nr:hypothetical protein SELMODRAFT_410074 [Selaginella moellendorffii]
MEGDVAAAAAATNESAALDLRAQEEPPGRSEEAAAIEPAESEIDRREAIAAPTLKAPPPSPEVDTAMAAGDSERQPKQHHHHHLRSGSAKNMARHSVLERSLSSTMAEVAPPDPKRSRGAAVEEPEEEEAEGRRSKCSTWKRRSCKCLVAFAGDCAALCCCPCTILHLVALICIRLPLTLLYGACSRLLRRRGWRRSWRSERKRRASSSAFSADIGETVVAVAAAAAAKLGGGGENHHHHRRSSFSAWPFGEPLVIDFPPYPGGFGDARHWSFFDSGSDGSSGSPKKSHSANAQPWDPQQHRHKQQQEDHQLQQEQ